MARDGSRGSTRRYPRTARIDKLIQAVVAEAIERTDDDRLGLVTVTDVHCDPDLRHATVFYVARDAKDDEELAEGLEEARVAAQSAIGKEARLKRTPQLKFEPDPVMETGWRIEELLRQERQKQEKQGGAADG
ncbi:MAG: 30S ribosome-binding factor RbfA [Acidimicrobiales bacterium]|nr:30S ribosome-binding factor RbfA [Acidimicrobiales bacterium]